MTGKTLDPQDGLRRRTQLIESIRRLHAFYVDNPFFPNYDRSHYNRFEARVAGQDLGPAARHA